jgi:glucuronoarabinoxylan endo-1,4-beta-xylanase
MKKRENILNSISKMLFLLCVSCLIVFPWKAQAQIQVNKQTTSQTIWGFGAAAEHTVSQLVNNLSAADQQAVLDKLFSTNNDNAGLSIIRLEVNAFKKTETDPTNTQRYTCEPSDGVWDWDTDNNQRWFAQEAKNRASDIKFLATPWSPPGWMKTNGSPINGGTLQTQYFDKYATYLKTWVDHYRNVYGFDIRWVSVQNEPSNNTTYASCTYSTGDLDIVTGKVADAIHSLNQGVYVGSPEGATRGISVNYMNGMSTSTKSKMDFIITHDYGGASSALAGYGKQVINTEVWSEAGNDVSIGDGIRWANDIKNALYRNEPGWLFWWCLDPYVQGQGLINLNGATYSIPKRLYAMGQYSRFMRYGDVRVDVTSTNGNLGVVASKNTAGNASIVVINNTNGSITSAVNGLSSQTLQVYRTSASENLAHLTDITIVGGSATVTFPAYSITTLVEGGTVCNNLPTITAISAKSFDVSAGVQSIALSGISDGDACTQGVTITATSSNPAVAAVSGVTYTSCNTTGTLALTPLSAGTATITVTATDGGKVGCSPATQSASFVVTVAQAITLPAKIEAENYTTMYGIQTETTTDAGGGLNVGYTDAGDYMDYYVNVPTTGSYTIDFRVASDVTTGKIELRNSAGTALATISQTLAAGWQGWSTKTVTANLTAGTQTLRIYYTGAGLNVNWFEVKSTTPVLTTITVSPATAALTVGQTQQFTAAGKDQNGAAIAFTPAWTATGGTITTSGLFTATTAGTQTITATSGTIKGTAVATVTAVVTGYAVPGVIQAENYTTMLGIQTETTTDAGGGLNVGYIDVADYMTYTVNVAAAGTYSVDFRVAGWATTGRISLQNAANTTLTSANVPNGGAAAYQVWSTVAGENTFTLAAGIQTIRIYATGSPWNLNWFEIKSVSTPVLTTITVSPATAALTVGQTQQFTAAGKDQNGAAITIAPTWTATGGTITIGGLYTATTAGTQTITATSGTISGSATATVTAVATGYAVPGVIQAENYATMLGIQTETTTDAGGGLNVGYVDVADYMTYTVNVAAAGTYSVSFRVAGWATTGRISLQNAANTTLTSANVPNGGTGAYQVWSTVNGEGNFTLAAGTQTIRIYATGSPWNLNWFELKPVEPSVLKSLVLSPENVTIVQDEQVCFKLTGYDQFGKAMPDVIFPDSWITPCGTLSAYGCFFGSEPGTCTFTAIKGDISATATVITLPKPILTTITVTPATFSLIPGQTQQFTAVGKDQNGATMTIAPLWTATGGTITTDGLYTATTAGTQTISATSGTISGSATATVTATSSYVIQAESYTGMYGIQTETTTDAGGGLNVGWLDIGDYMTYTVNIATAGTYNVNFRLAGWTTTGRISLQNAANTTLTSANVPNGGTNGYQVWSTVHGENTFTLAAGTQTIRIYATGAPWNLNWFEIYSGAIKSASDESTIPEISDNKLVIYPNPASDKLYIQTSDDIANANVFDISGKLLISKVLQGVDNEIDISSLKNGMYFININGEVNKFIKR